MANSSTADATIDTFYGPIALDASGLPQLQFDDGDLLVRLGDTPQDTLLLHSRVPATASYVFRRGLTGQWAAEKTTWLRHPATKTVVQVKVLALSVVDETFVLEGTPLPGKTSISLTSARFLFRTFFGLLYGAPLQFSASTDGRLSQAIIDLVSGLGALAEWYDCLHIIGPALCNAMRETGVFWSSIAKQRLSHARLAKKFRDSEAMYAAVRHMIAHAPQVGIIGDANDARKAWHTRKS
ncbi:hypothetical protein LTR95_000607 [Oleoguttula sp. CCFEE 5521]